MAGILINGKAYGWSQVVVEMLGRPVIGVKAISWKSSQEKENIYGAGNLPVARGYGNKEFEAAITLQMTEVVGLQSAVASKSLLDIGPFNINVSFVDGNNKLCQYVLQNCEFMEEGVDTEQGALEVDIELPLIISGVVKRV